jgi:hypothetical protein
VFSRIRSRFTYANVAATLALFFAMSGGALAASHYLITSTKQISPKVLKSLKGANGKNGTAGASGPAGPQGSAGAAGTKGEPGTPGGAGKEGTAGVSVTSAEFTGAKGPTCKEGGSEFTAASGKTYACNGTTGFAEVLPSGKTERGVWTVGVVSGAAFTPISFPITLASEIVAADVHYVTREEWEEAGGKKPPAACSGTAREPTAEKGNLCVYESEFDGEFIEFKNPAAKGTVGGAADTGTAIIFAEKTEPFSGEGTWAVTAP